MVNITACFLTEWELETACGFPDLQVCTGIAPEARVRFQVCSDSGLSRVSRQVLAFEGEWG